MQSAIGPGAKALRDTDESTSDSSLTDNYLQLPYEDIKLVSCICIPTVKVEKLGNKDVTLYQVVIKKKSYSYLIQKRFSDFVELNRQFNSKYEIYFDGFPSKVTFYRSREAVLKERKAALEKFMNYLRLVAIQNLDFFKFPELYAFLEMATCRKENILDISKNYSFSRMSGQFECNDIMGILEHLADNDQSSLKYIERLEKIIYANAKKLRRDDLSRKRIKAGYFLLGDTATRGYVKIYPSSKPLVEMVDRAYLSLLLRMLTPCNIVNNDCGRKYFGFIEAQAFKDLFFVKYLQQPKFSECKRLVYEIFTIYWMENPLLNSEPLFKSAEAKEKYIKWLQMSHPEIHQSLISSQFH